MRSSHYSCYPAFTRISSRLLLIVLWLLGGLQGLQAQISVLVPPTTNSGSSSSRGPNGSAQYQRVAALYRGTEIQNLPLSSSIAAIGFNILTPVNQVAQGQLKVYLVSSADPTYIRSDDWATLLATPTPMQLVYDGPLTIPTAAGWFDVQLNTPFTFTGTGFYLAYEWEGTVLSLASANYACNDVLPNSIRSGVGGAGQPSILNSLSRFRPQLRLTTAVAAFDASVLAVQGLSQVPFQPSQIPFTLKARVRNAGSAPLNNLAVSVTVAGPTSFQASQTVPVLFPGDSATVRFPGFLRLAPGRTW